MNYNETFKEIYGDTLPAGKSAFVMEMPLNTSNPIRAVSGYIPSGAKVTMKNRILYVLAERFTHPNAIKLAL